MKASITLMRHGTAIKNTRNEHGGKGTSLTPEGIDEIKKSAQYFIDCNYIIDKIYYVNKPQCVESATILSNELNIPSFALNDIRPFNLGVLDGLSEEESKQAYPEISEKMELWRAGKIDITELNIPDSTDPQVFFNDCVKTIKAISTQNALVIGTRSILVAFSSYLLGRKPIKGGGYVEIPWENAAYKIFNITKESTKLDKALNTDNLLNCKN